MERKLSHSKASPHCDRACIEMISSSGSPKNSSSGDAKGNGSAPTTAAEKSRGMQNSWRSNYYGRGKNSYVGYKSNGSPSEKSQQNSKAGVDAGRNGNPGSSPSNSRDISQYPSPSDLRNRSDPHSRSWSTPCSNREVPISDLTVGSCYPTDTSRASTVTDNQKTTEGDPNEVKKKSRRRGGRPGESERVLSFGNIYRSFQSGFRGNGMVCNEVNIVRTNSHVLGFGGGNYGHGNIIRGGNLVGNSPAADGSKNGEGREIFPTRGGNTCCKSMEELKNAGNEEYRRGHFTEAISLYDKGIALCPRNATCHNNKAAALASLGEYEEAVRECLEAISCNQSYLCAHHRLVNLYIRLGRVEDAKWHFKFSGQRLDSETMQKIRQLETHLINTRNARNAENWIIVLIESTLAIDAGADASNQVLAFKAEALLKLHKAEEALELLKLARKSEIRKNKCNPSLLIIEVQVYMYLGRFEDGVTAAERFVNLDRRPESLMWLRRVQAVADARKNGNELYKSGKYLEACIAYRHGMEYDPTNGVLLSNRAACRCKLGQWEMAIKDCDAALRNRPDYTKALLRRAHANAQLEYWEESLKDYKVLNQEMPDDISISRSLLQVQMKLKRVHCEDGYLQPGGQVTHLSSHTLFLKFIQSAGLALLQFFMRSDDRCRQLSPLVNELSQRYPSWNFLKVDVEENPDWAKFESVEIVPIFIIYKDGHKLREICKPDQQVLEHALKFHSSF